MIPSGREFDSGVTETSGSYDYERAWSAKTSGYRGSRALYWSVDPRVLTSMVKKNAQNLRAELIQAVFSKAVNLTPVRRGRARRSWRLGIGKIDRSYVTAGGTEKNPLPPPHTPGLARLRQIPLKTKIFISNSIPYIEYLEYGSPTTREYAMLRTALSQAQL